MLMRVNLLYQAIEVVSIEEFGKILFVRKKESKYMDLGVICLRAYYVTLARRF
jgi:hypothetical protein